MFLYWSISNRYRIILLRPFQQRSIRRTMENQEARLDDRSDRVSLRFRNLNTVVLKPSWFSSKIIYLLMILTQSSIAWLISPFIFSFQFSKLIEK
jgi:hypothetical protein